MTEVDDSDRAERAENALDVYGDARDERLFTDEVAGAAGDVGSDPCAMVRDLMTGLMHVVRRSGWNATALARDAVATFDRAMADGVETS